MKIRSVTCFVGVDETVSSELLRRSGNLAQASRYSLPRHGYEVQTTRLAVQPLDQIVQHVPAPEFARLFESKLREVGFDYGSLAVKSGTLLGQVAELVRVTERIFASIRIASRADGIDLEAIQGAAKVIYDLAHTTGEGFGNFRFAAAANVRPLVPYFPVAYHDGGPPCFALATEAADLAVESFTEAASLDEARSRLVSSLERHGAKLLTAGHELEDKYGLRFLGIDFSMGPYPEEARSLATALERLCGTRFGMRGTLFASAFLTDCLRRAEFRRAGFCGLMLPMMEDWTMAARSQEGLYSLDSLLLYSTVCGTGLDNVPLAGDTPENAISSLLLDLAALAVKLDKPLTARLIPVPGVQVGETTQFSFEYFANAKAFGIDSPGELKPFSSGERVEFGTTNV